MWLHVLYHGNVKSVSISKVVTVKWLGGPSTAKVSLRSQVVTVALGMPASIQAPATDVFNSMQLCLFSFVLYICLVRPCCLMSHTWLHSQILRDISKHQLSDVGFPDVGGSHAKCRQACHSE